MTVRKEVFVSQIVWLLVLLCVHGFSVKPIFSCEKMSNDEIVTFLMELGHLPTSYNQTENKNQLKEAIKSYQQSNRIRVSGFIDHNTCKLMTQPRCAGMILPQSLHSSKEDHLKHRVRRFANFELRWPRTNLTWRLVDENINNLNVDWVKGILKQALDVWSRETPLNFCEVNTKRADIEVGFSRSCELQAMFKTTQKILGYANPPNPVKVILRFNAEQNWTPSPDNKDSGSDLMYAAVHEFGHALGLDHSNVEEAVMYASYRNEFKGLHEDDRNGIQILYGPRGKDRSKKARMLRFMKGVRNNVRWKMLAISEPIKKIFRYVF
ncbi:matrix metalloproteinase-2-like [Sitodiplosis mosellana]|uniref:matrix metalloproteinase-2-like n=1 Tax=Sitodiplosis mosellana TaxID=263140 RepID=UPI002444BC7C|nr:matrix metalloproteinase-2-like [Sitodiplosis mosellana]